MNKNDKFKNSKKGNDPKAKGSRNHKRTKKGKEIEVNIPDSAINKADLRGAENDYTWYTKYSTLFENVSGVNFGNQVGAQLRWVPSLVEPASNVFPPTAAGVCAIHYIPTMGSADQTLSSPLNKVGSQIFSIMRQELGSTASYDPTDVVMYLGAMDSAFQLYTLGTKIYGMLQMASPFNNYFLKRMCNANCIDYDSFMSNMSNFRAKINTYAIFLSSREVPADFDIYKRHTWMIQNMFTDSNTAKAQIYTFVPDGYYLYTDSNGGPGYLKFVPFGYATNPSNLLTFSQWSAAIDSMYESLLNSSDINQMSADIGKAFKHEVFTLALIPDNYVTPISYSEEVMSQIENCVLCGEIVNTADPNNDGYNYTDIFQTTDLPRDPRIVQRIKTGTFISGATSATRTNLTQYCTMRYMLNFHKENPSKEDIIVATRGIPGNLITPATGTDYGNITVQGYGTEVYTYATLYYLDGTNTMQRMNYSYFTFNANSLRLLSLWNQFDWAPTFFALDLATGANAYRMQDLDMYALIDQLQAENLNITAVLSEFYSSKFVQPSR